MSEIKWSGVTSSYIHKCNPDKPNSPDEPKGLRKVWFLDAQWSTCPKEVEDQVKDLWRYFERGNDHYIIKISTNGLLEHAGSEIEKCNGSGWVTGELNVDAIVQYIREHNIPDDEQIVIHWWW